MTNITQAQVYPYIERDPRNATVYSHVQLDDEARVSPHAGIIGRVKVGARTCILAGAQVRGDDDYVEIGDECSVQEGACIHVNAGSPTIVGRGVTIGHGAIVHGCQIGDDALIGMGSIIMNGARVGEGAVIAAGALVAEGKEIPPRTLAVGVPAKPIRELSEEDVRRFCIDPAQEYVEVGAQMVAEGVLFTGAQLKA